MKGNLAFEASSIWAIGYVGALKYLDKWGYKYVNLAGASAGAVFASLLAAGYTAEELEGIVLETNFEELVGDLNLPLIEKLLLIVARNGIYTWDKFEAWLNGLLAAKQVYSFGDILSKGVVKSLKITATDITRGVSLILPDDLAQYGIDPLSYSVAAAVRMSSAIPFYFTPVILDFQGQADYISDGGVLYDFPVNIFEKEKSEQSCKYETLGIRITVNSFNFSTGNDLNILSFLSQLLGTVSNNNYVQNLTPQNIARSIYVPTLGISAFAFDLSNESKLALIEAGYDAASAYFKYNNCY